MAKRTKELNKKSEDTILNRSQILQHLTNMLYTIIYSKEANFEDFHDIPPTLLEVATSNDPYFTDTQAEHLLEISKLMKNDTGLPVDIWIDEGKTFIKEGHTHRIKFQGNKNDPNTLNWIPITVSKEPKISILNPHYNLDEQELSKVKEFIKINYDILNKIGEIGIIEFCRQMKKV